MSSCPIHRGNNTILYSSFVNQDEVQWLSSPHRYATNSYYVGYVSWEGAYFHDSFMWMTWNWNWRVSISIIEPHSSQTQLCRTDKWAPSMWTMLAKGFRETVHIIIAHWEKISKRVFSDICKKKKYILMPFSRRFQSFNLHAGGSHYFIDNSD